MVLQKKIVRMFMLKVREAMISSENHPVDRNVQVDEFVLRENEQDEVGRSFNAKKKNSILQYLLLILPVILLACSQSEKFKIQSEDIIIEFAEDFTCNIQWLPAGDNSTISFDTIIQQGIVVDGKTYQKFITNKTKLSKKRITDPEFGTGIEAIITGVFDEGELKIERTTRILLPDKFKGVVLFNTVYRNLGNKRVHIDSVFSQRILLKSRLKKPASQPANFASFQGGINEWGDTYTLIWLMPGFRQENSQGMHYTNPTAKSELMGSGMPFVDVWNKTMGVALMHIEKKPKWLSLPVNVHQDGTVEVSIVEKPYEEYGMQEWLNPNENFQTVQNAIVFHHLDFYDALNTYGELLRCRGINIMRTSPKEAYEPYWKSWSFGYDFTLDMIYKALPELKAIGINTANLDEGWFEYHGDWNGNPSPGKFPDGEKGIITFVDKLHEQGFKTNLWWYPLGVSPESNLATERPDLLVQAKDGSYPKDIERGSYQLCPAYEPAQNQIRDLVIKFTEKWGFDGLYSDTRGLSAVPPCYNKAHNHKSPLESFWEVPQVFKIIYETLQNYNKNAFQEVCICAAPHSPYNMPYYQIASASDPVSLLQVRSRIKAEKGIHGPTFAVGDCYQVPKDEWAGYSVEQSFESAMGTGAQVTTFYKDLDPSQLKEWKKWFSKYRELELSSAEYVNLYDLAFDKPEIHVVRKENSFFYGIFADSVSKTESIQLRGLDKDVEYSAYDYANDKQLETINGNNPIIHADFKENLLLQLTPLKK